MRSLLLYSAFARALENKITAVPNIVISNNAIDYKSDYQIAVYIASDTPANQQMDGKTFGGSAAVEFLVQSGMEKDTDIKTRQIVQTIEKFIESLKNFSLTTEDYLELLDNDEIHYVFSDDDRQVENGDGINISANARIMQYGTYIGDNEAGRMMFSINAIVSYYIQGNNIVTSTNNTEEEESTENNEPADNSELAADSDLTEVTQEEN